MIVNGQNWQGFTFHDNLVNAPIFRVDYSTINGVVSKNYVAVVKSDLSFYGEGKIVGTPSVSAQKAIFNVELSNGATGTIEVDMDAATPGLFDISTGKVTCILSAPGSAFVSTAEAIKQCHIML